MDKELRLDFCEMSKKFSASGVPKTLGRPSSYFHRAVWGTQGSCVIFWRKITTFWETFSKLLWLKMCFDGPHLCIFCVFVFLMMLLFLENLEVNWAFSEDSHVSLQFYTSRIAHRTSNPLKKTALFVLCVVFFV